MKTRICCDRLRRTQPSFRQGRHFSGEAYQGKDALMKAAEAMRGLNDINYSRCCAIYLFTVSVQILPAVETK